MALRHARILPLGAVAYYLYAENNTDAGISITLCDGGATWRCSLLPCDMTPPSGMPLATFHGRLLDGLTIRRSSELALNAERCADGSMNLVWDATIEEEDLKGFARRHRQEMLLLSADTRESGLVKILGALATKCSALQEDCERKQREVASLQGRLEELNAVQRQLASSHTTDARQKRRSDFLGCLNHTKRRIERLNRKLESHDQGGDALALSDAGGSISSEDDGPATDGRVDCEDRLSANAGIAEAAALAGGSQRTPCQKQDGAPRNEAEDALSSDGSCPLDIL